MSSDKPVLIEGGLSVDDRGQIAFCNGFDFADSSILRLYLTSNCAGSPRMARAQARAEVGDGDLGVGFGLCGVGYQLAKATARHASLPVHPLRCEASHSRYSPWLREWLDVADRRRAAAVVLDCYARRVRCRRLPIPARYWDCWKVEER